MSCDDVSPFFTCKVQTCEGLFLLKLNKHFINSSCLHGVNSGNIPYRIDSKTFLTISASEMGMYLISQWFLTVKLVELTV